MNDTTTTAPTALKPEDFASDQSIRWCPGCGDHSVISQTRKVLAKLGVDRSKTVFISGIGCSSRFPYYMNTYGMHTIHGRAPTFATGLKLTRPELDVWIVTGDGDSLSIGGNHFLHLIRRNLDVKVILLNNRIYGMTKGQYSPTSPRGQETHSSPMGSPDRPLRPLTVALGLEATFAARTLDVDVKHLAYVLERAAHHVGTAIVEVYQNCTIFNDGAYQSITDKDQREEHTLYLEHGKPLTFGKDRQKGIGLSGMSPRVVDLTREPATDVLVHDEKADGAMAFALSRMTHPDMPEVLGVFRAVEADTHNAVVATQRREALTKHGSGDLAGLLRGRETWTVQ